MMSSIVGIYDLIYKNEIAKYYFRFLINDYGDIELDLIQELYSEMFLQSSEMSDLLMGPFDDIKAMRRFLLELGQKCDALYGSLLSVTKYNELLEQTTEFNNFFERLVEKGDLITCKETSKSNLISNLFGH